MQKVYAVLKDLGDGSSTIEWFRNRSEDEVIAQCEADEFDSYQSGDGIQITELTFPDNFDLSSIGGIYWEDNNDD